MYMVRKLENYFLKFFLEISVNLVQAYSLFNIHWFKDMVPGGDPTPPSPPLPLLQITMSPFKHQTEVNTELPA